MRKIIVLMLGLCIAASCLAGCGGTQSNYDEDGFMTLSVWGGDEYVGETGAKMNAFLTKFNDSAAAKALKVRLTFKSMTQLPNTLSTACMTGKIPDLVVWDRFSTPSYNHLLVEISDMIAADSVDVLKFQEEALSELKFDGKLYGLPLDLDPWGIYINLDIVESYNQTADEADRIDVDDLGTWSKLLDAADKLTVRDGTTVTRSGLNTTSMDGQFFSFVYTGGGELINTDKTSSTFGDTTLVGATEMQGDADSKRVYDVLSYFRQLYDKNVCATGHGGTDAFVNGLLAMTYGSIYFPNTVKQYTEKEMNMKMIPFPRRDISYTGNNSTVVNPDEENNGMVNGQYGGVLGGYGLCIPNPAQQFQNSKWQERRDMAWKVIKLWLLDDDMQKTFFTTTEQITARVDLQSDAFYDAESNMKQILPYLSSYRMRPNVEGYEQFETNVVRSQIQTMREGATALTTYNKIRDDGNTLLRQYQGRG